MQNNINSLREFMKFLLHEEVQLNSLTFDLNKLKSIKGFDDIRAYIYDNLKYLARGSARTTYVIDNDTILKFVNTPYFNSHNKNEVKHATCLGQSHAPIIVDYDKENFYWIVEERLQPITGDELFDKLEQLIGVRFKSWTKLKDFFSNTHNPGNPEFDEVYERSEWLRKLVDEIRTCDVSADDFHDENWGIRQSTGELVLLDLGF